MASIKERENHTDLPLIEQPIKLLLPLLHARRTGIRALNVHHQVLHLILQPLLLLLQAAALRQHLLHLLLSLLQLAAQLPLRLLELLGPRQTLALILAAPLGRFRLRPAAHLKKII